MDLLSEYKISVVITSYNYARFIRETIDSVIAQTYPVYEIIIVDDGSDDDSLSIISEYTHVHNNIKLLIHPNHTNKGLAESLYLGITEAVGDWIVFLESDDYLRPDSIVKRVDVLKTYPDVSLVFSNVKTVGEGNLVLQHLIEIPEMLKRYSFPALLTKCFILRNVIPTFSVVMVLREKILTCSFDTPVDESLDSWLWSQLISWNEVYYIDEPLTFYRIHNKSYSANSFVNGKFLHLWNKIRLRFLIIYFLTKTNAKSKLAFLKRPFVFLWMLFYYVFVNIQNRLFYRN